MDIVQALVVCVSVSLRASRSRGRRSLGWLATHLLSLRGWVWCSRGRSGRGGLRKGFEAGTRSSQRRKGIIPTCPGLSGYVAGHPRAQECRASVLRQARHSLRGARPLARQPRRYALARGKGDVDRALCLSLPLAARRECLPLHLAHPSFFESPGGTGEKERPGDFWTHWFRASRMCLRVCHQAMVRVLRYPVPSASSARGVDPSYPRREPAKCSEGVEDSTDDVEFPVKRRDVLEPPGTDAARRDRTYGATRRDRSELTDCPERTVFPEGTARLFR